MEIARIRYFANQYFYPSGAEGPGGMEVPAAGEFLRNLLLVFESLVVSRIAPNIFQKTIIL